MKRYTYIEMEEIGWKDHLMYAMPVNRMIDNDHNSVQMTSDPHGTDSDLLVGYEIHDGEPDQSSDDCSMLPM